MKTVKRGRGRPKVYNFNQKTLRHFLALVKKHNAVKTREILQSPADSDLGKLRSQKIFPNPLTISMPIMLQIVSKAGLQLKKGRPKVKKAA